MSYLVNDRLLIPSANYVNIASVHMYSLIIISLRVGTLSLILLVSLEAKNVVFYLRCVKLLGH